MVESDEITRLPKTLTSTVVRKHFPHQDLIRSKAQLSKRPVPKYLDKHSSVSYCGEQGEIDIFMVNTPTYSMPRANGVFRHVLLVDVFFSCLSYVPIKTMSKPIRLIESVVTMYQNCGHPIKLLKMDHQFNTLDICYLDSMHILHQFALMNINFLCII